MPVPVVPAQIPEDRYLFDTSVLVYPTDLHNAFSNTITERDYDLADLYNGQNGVFGSGCQVSSPGPNMTFAVSAGRGRCLSALKTVQLVTPGITGQPASFNFTIPNGSAIPAGQSRIDIVGLQYSWTTYTDADGFNHQVDTTGIATVQGNAAVSPVAPTFPNNQYTQIATVTVPTGATSASQCTINNTARTKLTDVVTLQQGFPSGIIAPYGGPVAPASWALCDGSELDPAVQVSLFNAIGYTYGHGAGSNFKVPKFNNNSIPIGADGATIIVGGTGGAKTVTLAIANMPSHAHTDAGHIHTVTDPQHNHNQNAHNHATTDTGHTHTQNAHNHTDSGHNHTQNAHGHTDTGHSHNTTDPGHSHFVYMAGNTSSPGKGVQQQFNPLPLQTDTSNAFTTSSTTGISINSGSATISNGTGTNNAGTAVIANNTATNNSATTGVAVSNATGTNSAASTGMSVNSGAAALGATGGGTAFSILPPYVGCNFIIKL